jgi:hypothetical protein
VWGPPPPPPSPQPIATARANGCEIIDFGSFASIHFRTDIAECEYVPTPPRTFTPLSPPQVDTGRYVEKGTQHVSKLVDAARKSYDEDIRMGGGDLERFIAAARLVFEKDVYALLVSFRLVLGRMNPPRWGQEGTGALKRLDSFLNRNLGGTRVQPLPQVSLFIIFLSVAFGLIGADFRCLRGNRRVPQNAQGLRRCL